MEEAPPGEKGVGGSGDAPLGLRDNEEPTPGCGEGGDAPLATQPGVEEGEKEVDPFWPPIPGGVGPARGCYWKGTTVPFHDGGCLLSPGRWDYPKRRFQLSERWGRFRALLRKTLVRWAGGESQLERECFSMAGGERGCRLVQNEGLQGELLEVMVDFVSGGEDLKRVEDGQPFRLGLIKALLEETGDGDCAFLQEAVEGFPLGVKHPLPRTPAAFEKQVEWALSYDPSEGCDLTRSNYPSAAEHEDHLRSHLEEELAEGLVAKMTEREFEEMYGQDRAISALAVLVEDEVSGKKRVIHDASHGVKVNHRIKCRDKLRMPGGREKRCLLEKFQRSKDVVFSLIGDFGKAHRRFKYRRDECGFLACRVSDNDPYIYVNCVGTFGVSSTPYWWGRLSGALLRLVHQLLGPGVPVEMLLYADDLEGMGINKEGRQGLVMAFVFLAVLGAPFKWKKQRGGLCTEWIGLTTDYRKYSMGLSEKRASWLVTWMRETCACKMVDPREFSAVLGRLGFAASALPWERPFLGPLYVWAAAVRGQQGKVIVPWAILVIMEWLSRRLSAGGRMEEIRGEPEAVAPPAVFYTDARASDEDAGIGGYLAVSPNLSECPWFSLEVDEILAPWLKVRGGKPKRVIAALELLASLIAVKIWGKLCPSGFNGRMKAFTDNRGNAFALVKGMSTKYPLTLLLMELAEELRCQDLRMDLEWVKREENEAADALSNGDWSSFDEKLRVEVKSGEIEWRILKEVQERSEDLYKEIQDLKEQKKLANSQKGSSAAARAKGKVLPRW